MLSMFKSKPKPSAQIEPEPVAIPVEETAIEPAEPLRRARQQNIKASEDCCMAFDAIAKSLRISKAALFEDMVAERYEALRRQGVNFEVSAG